MKHVEQACQFDTSRLRIRGWSNPLEPPTKLTREVISILSPEVTASLPAGWQAIRTIEAATSWIRDRDEESHVMTIHHMADQALAGFIFLYESDPAHPFADLRFGYLLAKKYWGRGLGTEVIAGLINWCRTTNRVHTLSGGVERVNAGSIRVLEKNGFGVSEEESTPETIFYVYRF